MPDDPPAEALAALEAIDFNAQDRPVIATLSHDDACRLAWVLHTAEVDGSDVLSADAAIRQARYRITWSKRGERAEEEPLTVVAHLFRAELDFVAFYMRAGEWDSPTLIIRASDVREIRELSDDD
jgi:hypothetical protein